MSAHELLFRDVFSHLRDQVAPADLDRLSLLALEDPTLFIVEVICSTKVGRVALPAPAIRSLKDELFRLRMPILESHELDEDLVTIRQRRVDTVARQLRGRGDQHDSSRSRPRTSTLDDSRG